VGTHCNSLSLSLPFSSFFYLQNGTIEEDDEKKRRGDEAVN